jgi:hypothetical protein
MEIFRTFKDAPAAEDLASWLCRRGINAVVSDTSAYFDPSFAHSVLSREWSVRIPSADFTKASDELHHFYEQRLELVPVDYYLFSFTDAELEEILRKPDEWGDLDYALANNMLHRRGKGLSDEQIGMLRTKRYESLSKPEAEEAGKYLTWGYVLAVLGGFLGSLIGWHLINSCKTLPDGKKLPRYPDAARAHGRRIFWVGIVVTVSYAFLRMYFSIRAASRL